MTALISAEHRAAAAAVDVTHARDSLKTSRAVRNRSTQAAAMLVSVCVGEGQDSWTCSTNATRRPAGISQA